MTTLKDRFAEKFCDTQDDWGVSVVGYNVTTKDVLVFFQQELMALAEEINEMNTVNYDIAEGHFQASEFIRSKAAELTT